MCPITAVSLENMSSHIETLHPNWKLHIPDLRGGNQGQSSSVKKIVPMQSKTRQVSFPASFLEAKNISGEGSSSVEGTDIDDSIIMDVVHETDNVSGEGPVNIDKTTAEGNVHCHADWFSVMKSSFQVIL